MRTGGRGSRSLRTYCDWVVSNAEIDHLTQVNLYASAGQVNLRMRTGGGGGLVARVRRAYRRGRDQKYPEVLRTY